MSDMENALTAAADELAIQRVVARYASAVDSKRWADLGDVFVPGAAVDYSANGGAKAPYPDVVEYLRGAMGIFAATQHYMMNFDLEIAGDGARGRFYSIAQMVTIEDGRDRLLTDGAYYDAAFVRTPAGWRISELVARMVWLDGDWPKGVPFPAWYGVSTSRF
jgi:hypothetical protein